MEKTLWRKNLDKRYISGEDLLNGIAAGKGLKPEMTVTISKYEDSPAFDQKKQEEVDKTAVWLKEYPSGKPVYKPMLLNVTNGEFLSKEIGNNSIFIDDFDTTKPFVIYAMAHKRHGHVCRCKKYYPPATVTDANAIAKLNVAEKTSEALNAVWGELSAEEKKLPSVLAVVNKLKGELK